MAPKENRKRKIGAEEREEYRIKKQKEMECFSRNALPLIRRMVELNATHPTWLLDEILHSIFFLGKLKDSNFSPERMARTDADVKTLKMLRKLFPRPFALYSSQVPKRSPFSCVLDMIVQLYGRQVDEKEIIKGLQDCIKQLDPNESKVVVSSTICVSQSNIPESVRYYGVSMSTTGPYPGRIMIAASCLSSWDSYVADAVMTYYPTQTKKPDFDGTIKLQPHVRCQAFSIRLGGKKPPCKSCGNLFGLETSQIKQSAYGNCAEAESLSNLLKEVEHVREQVQPTSETCTDENREKVKESVLTELKRLLSDLKFEWDNEENFYDPRVRS